MLWAIPLAWLAYGILGPVKLRSDRNVHNVLFVWLREQGENGNHQPSVKVQEVGEWRLAKMIGVTVGLVAAFALPDSPVALFAVCALTLVPDALCRKVNAIDYAGHGAEIMHAEAAGIFGYREAEIARMQQDRDKRGQGVAANLDRMRWLSRVIYLLGRW